MISAEFIITSLIVVLIPGTGVIYTISTGMLLGSRASIAASIGCTAGIIPHLLATVLGLAALMHVSAVAFQIVKFIGVAYLFFLAYSMWKETGKIELNSKIETKGYMDIAIKGFLINILNPKLSIFFLAFLPQFMPASSITPTMDMTILGFTFMLMTFVVFVVYGVFASGARTYVLKSTKIMSRLQKSFAVTFAALGTRLAFMEK